jgi:Rho GDP-dissociation inhibitor
MVDHDDELAPTKTDGYKIGEKKTVEEYQKLGKTSSYLLSFRLST